MDRNYQEFPGKKIRTYPVANNKLKLILFKEANDIKPHKEY